MPALRAASCQVGIAGICGLVKAIATDIAYGGIARDGCFLTLHALLGGCRLVEQNSHRCCLRRYFTRWLLFINASCIIGRTQCNIYDLLTLGVAANTMDKLVATCCRFQMGAWLGCLTNKKHNIHRLSRWQHTYVHKSIHPCVQFRYVVVRCEFGRVGACVLLLI